MLLNFVMQAYQLWSKWRRGALYESFLQGVPVSEAVDGVEGLIGNTPLVRIRSLSEQTGCEVRKITVSAFGSACMPDHGQTATSDRLCHTAV